MMTFYDKKGISPIGLLGEILIVLAVIVIILAIVIVPRLQTQGDIIGIQIGGIQGDADKDSIRNFFDKCPCTFGEDAFEGCPATVTKEQKEADVKNYHSDPPCGIVAGETTTTQQAIQQKPTTQEPAEQKAEQKSEPAAFKKYQSIEIFGHDDRGADPKDEVIQQACTGFVGGKGATDCHSEDDDCDGEFKPGSKPLTEGCWVMASEDDNDGNDCGQAKVKDGEIIDLDENRVLDVDLGNNYEGDKEPKNLFQWAWDSKYIYGSLICNQGFWYGCRENNEGRTLEVNDQTYKCTGSEWVKQ